MLRKSVTNTVGDLYKAGHVLLTISPADIFFLTARNYDFCHIPKWCKLLFLSILHNEYIKLHSHTSRVCELSFIPILYTGVYKFNYWSISFVTIFPTKANVTYHSSDNGKHHFVTTPLERVLYISLLYLRSRWALLLCYTSKEHKTSLNPPQQREHWTSIYYWEWIVQTK